MQTTIMDAAGMDQTLQAMVEKIKADNGGTEKLAVVGIHTRGYFLGQRLAQRLDVPSGSLDIALYRDDLNRRGVQPLLKRTDIPFSIEELELVLVDDVLFTGRTVRAALDALADLGRPRAVKLAVLVDRGNRELPIHADYCGHEMETAQQQRVTVRLAELDGEDGVYLEESEARSGG